MFSKNKNTKNSVTLIKKFISYHPILFLGYLICIFGFVLTNVVNWSPIMKVLDLISLNKNHDSEAFLLWIIIFMTFLFFDFLRTERNRRREQTSQAYKSMIYASNHILRNFLNQVSLMRYEAERITEFDAEAIKSFDDSIKEAEALLQELSKRFDARSCEKTDFKEEIQKIPFVDSRQQRV